MSHSFYRLADRQLGLVSVVQLRGLGLSKYHVQAHVKAGRLVRLRRNVYRVSGVPVSWEQAVLAAVLATGGCAVVSHTTAAALWDLKHSDRYGAGLHLTAPRQLRAEGVTGHVARLSGAERTVHRLIPVTTPERTVADLASTLGPRQLGECVDDALRRRLLSLERIDRLVATAPCHGRLLAPLRGLLADRFPGYRPGDSDWERQMDRLWDRLGLPTAARQHPVKARGHRYRIDRAIPELKIGVEWDGFATHGTRSGFDQGSDRRADLTAEGWHMINFTSNSTPDRIVAAVLQVADERRAAAARKSA